jgi:hypothetical protein
VGLRLDADKEPADAPESVDVLPDLKVEDEEEGPDENIPNLSSKTVVCLI